MLHIWLPSRWRLARPRPIYPRARRATSGVRLQRTLIFSSLFAGSNAVGGNLDVFDHCPRKFLNATGRRFPPLGIGPQVFAWRSGRSRFSVSRGNRSVQCGKSISSASLRSKATCSGCWYSLTARGVIVLGPPALRRITEGAKIYLQQSSPETQHSGPIIGSVVTCTRVPWSMG
jgi:hypothetical protein